MLIVGVYDARAQFINPDKDRDWVDLGCGGYISSKLDVYPAGISVNLIRKETLFKFRNITQQNPIAVFGSTNNNGTYADVGVLAGRGFSGKVAHAFLCGGVGFIEVRKKEGHSEEVHFFKPAIPLELDIQLKVIKHVGLGVSFFGNLNTERSTSGFLVKLCAGKLRPGKSKVVRY